MKYSQIIDNHNNFKMKRLWEIYEENKQLWAQCVAWAKIYAKEVYGITLWSFWWTAFNGRSNKNNTFDPKLFNKVLYNGTNKPPVWALVFFNPDKSNWNSWHVGICDLRIKKGISILEQNGGWKWNNEVGDQFTLRNRGLQKLLWRYIPILDDNIK